MQRGGVVTAVVVVLGSLIKLVKMPASTVQLLGAEKALFRALKKKQATPKYGIIYHVPLVANAANKAMVRC